MRVVIQQPIVSKCVASADGVVPLGAESVLNKQIHHHHAVAAVGGCVAENELPCSGMRHPLVEQRTSGADGVVAHMAESVALGQNHHQIVETAVVVTHTLGINARRGVAGAVGVEMSAPADRAVHGVAQGVVYCKHNHQIAVAAVGGTQVLGVNARLGIWRVVDTVHRTAAQMAVGIDTCSGAYRPAKGVAKGVVHRNTQHHSAVASVH